MRHVGVDEEDDDELDTLSIDSNDDECKFFWCVW